MTLPPPPAADVPTAEARRNLSDILNRVAYGKERVVVTRHGKELAAIVPVEDLRLLDRVKALAARRETAAALRDLAEGSAVAWDELRRELGL